MMNPDMSVWTGRDDTPTEGPNALRWWQCVKPYTPDAEPGIVLIGFACDEGVRRNGGRVGAKDGPRALRKALANMAWHQDCPVYDAGDVTCEGQELEAAQSRLADTIAEMIRRQHSPLVIGGGHETAWGTFQGIFQSRTEKIGIINLDAHLDVRKGETATSGTPFAQMHKHCTEDRPFSYRCYGVSMNANTSAVLHRDKEDIWDMFSRSDSHMTPWFMESIVREVDEYVSEKPIVYLSVDLDVLPGWVMPAVSAPAARGVSLEIIENLIARVAAMGNLAACDIVEFNPKFDSDGQAARTAARLVWTVASAWNRSLPNV